MAHPKTSSFAGAGPWRLPPLQPGAPARPGPGHAAAGKPLREAGGSASRLGPGGEVCCGAKRDELPLAAASGLEGAADTHRARGSGRGRPHCPGSAAGGEGTGREGKGKEGTRRAGGSLPPRRSWQDAPPGLALLRGEQAPATFRKLEPRWESCREHSPPPPCRAEPCCSAPCCPVPSQAEPCCAEPQPRCPRSTRPSPAAPAGLGRAAAHHVGPARRLGVGRVTQGEEELPCLALPCPALTRTACIPRVLRACLLLPWKPPPSVQPRVPLPRTRCPAPGSFPRSSPVCIPASWLPFCLQASLPLPGHAPLLPCAGLPLQSHFLCPERAPGWC